MPAVIQAAGMPGGSVNHYTIRPTPTLEYTNTSTDFH